MIKSTRIVGEERTEECRKRKDNSAENFAMLRHLTRNLLKQEKSILLTIA